MVHTHGRTPGAHNGLINNQWAFIVLIARLVGFCQVVDGRNSRDSRRVNNWCLKYFLGILAAHRLCSIFAAAAPYPCHWMIDTLNNMVLNQYWPQPSSCQKIARISIAKMLCSDSFSNKFPLCVTVCMLFYAFYAFYGFCTTFLGLGNGRGFDWVKALMPKPTFGL